MRFHSDHARHRKYARYNEKRIGGEKKKTETIFFLLLLQYNIMHNNTRVRKRVLTIFDYVRSSDFPVHRGEWSSCVRAYYRNEGIRHSRSVSVML